MKPRRLVLVVDDLESWRQTCAEYLGYYDFRVETADSGEAALDKAVELHPDLVIMDLAMPGMDGCEATRRLKSDQRTRDVPVVALTAYASEEMDHAAREAGCSAVLRKPVTPRALLHAVLQHLNRSLAPRRSA